MCYFFSSTLPTLLISGKKKKKKKIQQDGKAKVEQVEPRFLKGYDPELVIEELCKGKPRGKKAFAGYKVWFSFLIIAINCSLTLLFLVYDFTKKLHLFDELVESNSVISNDILPLNRLVYVILAS